MDPIISRVVILRDNLTTQDGTIIPLGAPGFVITEKYLETSSFSPDDFDDLLRKAEDAKSEGLFYVDFKNFGKCEKVHPNLVL